MQAPVQISRTRSIAMIGLFSALYIVTSGLTSVITQVGYPEHFLRGIFMSSLILTTRKRWSATLMGIVCGIRVSRGSRAGSLSSTLYYRFRSSLRPRLNHRLKVWRVAFSTASSCRGWSQRIERVGCWSIYHYNVHSRNSWKDLRCSSNRMVSRHCPEHYIEHYRSIHRIQVSREQGSPN